MNIKITEQLKQEYNSLVKFPLETKQQWQILQQEIATQTCATGQPYFEISSLETKSGRPEIINL